MPKKLIMTIVIELSFITCIFAAPVVTSINGQVSHGSNLNIYGYYFGEKVNSSPIIWDNAENGSVKYNWSSVMPINSVEDVDRDIAYRTSAEATKNSGWIVSQAHSHSTRFICGGHGYSATDSTRGPNVAVGKEIGQSDYLYCSFYYRTNAEWENSYLDNYKLWYYTGDCRTFAGSGFYVEFNPLK